MDSGNSGSMQSSSGGDEEYDSRTESISPLLNPSLSSGSIPNHPQPPPPLSHHHIHPPTLFDHNLVSFSHSAPNLDLVWSRSEPIYGDLGNLTALSSQALMGAGPGTFPTSSSVQLPSADQNRGRASPTSDQNVAVKNSRKRTRASRRAPTTVLTTDTTNFRQMVQEFTGIPAGPFSAPPFSRSRLDLFGGAGPALRSGNIDTLGPLYPFRPSVHKAQSSPFLSSSSSSTSPSLFNSTMIDAIASTTSTTNEANTITSMAGPSNTFSSYQLPLDPIRTFQSLLQSPLKYPLLNGPAFGPKSQGNLTISSLDELGLAHDHHHHLNVNLSSAASASDFHDKGLERNEGTVDSWICPSE